MRKYEAISDIAKMLGCSSQLLGLHKLNMEQVEHLRMALIEKLRTV